MTDELDVGGGDSRHHGRSPVPHSIVECQYHHKNLLDRIVALVPPTLNS